MAWYKLQGSATLRIRTRAARKVRERSRNGFPASVAHHTEKEKTSLFEGDQVGDQADEVDQVCLI